MSLGSSPGARELFTRSRPPFLKDVVRGWLKQLGTCSLYLQGFVHRQRALANNQMVPRSRGKRREMGLGRMGLKEARNTVEELRRQIRAGLDPIEARRAAGDNKAAVPTFESISREVIAEAQLKSTNEKVRYQWELLLGPRYCTPILHKPVNAITTLDIETVLRPVWRKKPETGRKLLMRLRRVFDYARVHLRHAHGIIIQHNPAAWQDLRDRGFERSTKLSRGRQAALDYERATEFLE